MITEYGNFNWLGSRVSLLGYQRKSNCRLIYVRSWGRKRTLKSVYTGD